MINRGQGICKAQFELTAVSETSWVSETTFFEYVAISYTCVEGSLGTP